MSTYSNETRTRTHGVGHRTADTRRRLLGDDVIGLYLTVEESVPDDDVSTVSGSSSVGHLGTDEDEGVLEWREYEVEELDERRNRRQTQTNSKVYILFRSTDKYRSVNRASGQHGPSRDSPVDQNSKGP